MKLPAFQFYPGDWRKDSGVQSLDYEARGVWFEILCLMHESTPRGVLTLNNKAMPESALARLLGLDENLLKQILTKLTEHGVASVEPTTGALMSRRMVRDEKLRQTRAECGKQGGNPRLLKQNPTNEVTTGDKQIPTPSSSSSSSSSSSISSSDNNVGHKAAKAAPTSDADWLESLKVDPAYIGIDVAIEHAKASRWCETNRKQLSRRRFVNWLNRAERPIGSAKPQGEFANAW